MKYYSNSKKYICGKTKIHIFSSATTKVHIFFLVQIQGGKVIRRSGPAASYARLREKLWRLRTPFSLQYNCTVQRTENTETNTNPECVEKA